MYLFVDVLVVSKRNAARLGDLTREEVADLFCSAQEVGVMIEKVFAASSLSLVVQDGKNAGQTVPHVHVHVIPRREGDFVPNDIIYDILEGKATREIRERVDCNDRPPRNKEEMAKEAAWLSSFFSAKCMNSSH